MNINENERLVATLCAGGVAIIPSDTIYGIVGRADLHDTVVRIRDIKKREMDQAFVVLCADIDQVKKLAHINDKVSGIVTRYWPGPNTVILQPKKALPEIQGLLEGIGFRIPDKKDLRSLLRQTGPLVAPSANPKGQRPASTIQEAQEYFGDAVDVYVDGGAIQDIKPSRIIKLFDTGTEEIVRN